MAQPIGVKMEECREDLGRAAAEYLAEQSVLAALLEVATELLHDYPDVHMHSNRDGQGAPQRADTKEGTCSSEALASLLKTLQVSSLMQHLEVPALHPSSETLGTVHVSDTSSSQDTELQLADLVGSMHHVMGVAPRHLRQLFLPKPKAAQKAHKRVIAILEARLQQHAQAAVTAITASEKTDVGAAVQADQLVRQKQAILSQLQQVNMQQLQQLHSEAAAYLQDLDDIHNVLQQLVGVCMLQEQPRLHEAQRDFAHASMQTCISKLHLMQLQLWGDTYDATNIRALAEVSKEQQQLDQQLSGAINQAEAQLSEYKQLGSEFDNIVQEYSEVLAKIQQVDHTLDYMTALAKEAAGNTDF